MFGEICFALWLCGYCNDPEDQERKRQLRIKADAVEVQRLAAEKLRRDEEKRQRQLLRETRRQTKLKEQEAWERNAPIREAQRQASRTKTRQTMVNVYQWICNYS